MKPERFFIKQKNRPPPRAPNKHIGYDSSLLYKIQHKTDLKKAVIQVAIHSFIHHLCNKQKKTLLIISCHHPCMQEEEEEEGGGGGGGG